MRQRIEIGTRVLVARSCHLCGLMKDADHFRVSRGRRQIACLKCEYKQANQSNKVSNHESWEYAKKSRSPWSDTDVKVLDEMTKAGSSIREIARVLERSIQAVTIARGKYLSKESV